MGPDHRFFINYVSEATFPEKPKSEADSLAAKFLAGGQACFAVGRFVGVGIMHFVKPRQVFLVYLTMCIVFIAPSIVHHGYVGMSMLYLTLFFESICFPTIVSDPPPTPFPAESE